MQHNMFFRLWDSTAGELQFQLMTESLSSVDWISTMYSIRRLFGRVCIEELATIQATRFTECRKDLRLKLLSITQSVQKSHLEMNS